jgi:hypothetical protein
MVAGDHDHGAAGAPDLLNGEVDSTAARSIGVEEVASDDQEVNILADGDVDDRAEGLMRDGTRIKSMWSGPIAVDIQMHVRCV